MKATSVTQHAVERYMERSGVTSAESAIHKLLNLASRATPIGGNKCFAGGWVLVVLDDTVKTCFRPGENVKFQVNRAEKKIHRAHGRAAYSQLPMADGQGGGRG